MENKTTPRNIDLMKLYEIACIEMRMAGDGHQARLNSILAFIAALLAATVAGLIACDDPQDYWFLLLGPFAIISAAFVGKALMDNFYETFLRAFVFRAKLEQELKLTEYKCAQGELSKGSDPYWVDEPLIALRDINSRKEVQRNGETTRFDSSEEFFNDRMKHGNDQLAVKRLTYAVTALALILLVIIGVQLSSSTRQFQPSSEMDAIPRASQLLIIPDCSCSRTATPQ